MTTIVRAHRWRRLPYTILNGYEALTVKAHSAISALRRIALTPGARVRVWIPVIVHDKRVRAARKRRLARQSAGSASEL